VWAAFARFFSSTPLRNRRSSSPECIVPLSHLSPFIVLYLSCPCILEAMRRWCTRIRAAFVRATSVSSGSNIAGRRHMMYFGAALVSARGPTPPPSLASLVWLDRHQRSWPWRSYTAAPCSWGVTFHSILKPDPIVVPFVDPNLDRVDWLAMGVLNSNLGFVSVEVSRSLSHAYCVNYMWTTSPAECDGIQRPLYKKEAS
jgi:hypothetical protein